ncbi:MAG TPA: M56 family metallopeptidase [Bryobacteraceae bacterium]|nr:M56 family metallopeptidase [Bryobacteraceae bacterium]
MINHLIQSTLFAAVIALLVGALRRNRARVRYWLWFAASMKFLIPFSLLVGMGTYLGWQAPPAIEAASLSVMPTLRNSSPAPVVTAPSEPPSAETYWMADVAMFVWACGFVAWSGRWWLRWARVRDLARAGTPVRLDLDIDVRSSATAIEPGVFGIFRPVLLLPEGITESLTPAQLQTILAHEMCHVRSRDNLATVVQMLAESVFWFYPLVWWLGARLVEERERACDEDVLARGGDREAYAEGILKVCEMYLTASDCVAGVSGASLPRRIEEIMTARVLTNLGLGRRLLLTAAGVAAVSGPVFFGALTAPARAQGLPAATARFEVASIRPCKEGGRNDQKMGPPGGSPTVSPGRLNTGCALLAANYPMSGLIQRAYGRLKLGFPPPALGSTLPISGGPAWIYSDYYVINAEAAEKAGAEAMEGPMLQALLEDRFQLKVHRETRQVPVYVLTVARGGSKLQQVAPGSCVPPDYSTWPMPTLPQGKTYCASRGAGGRKGPNTMIHEDEATVDFVCKLLGLVMDRPVIDKTGLTGQYKFDLEFAIDQSTPGVGPAFGPQSDDPPAPSIFTVMQRLGMKLEATKGPRDFLVIDRVVRPPEN